MPAGQRGIRVPIERCVVVGVKVDCAGGYDAAAGINLLSAPGADPSADLGYASILDGHVPPIPRDTSTVYDGASPDHQVIFSYDTTSLCIMLETTDTRSRPRVEAPVMSIHSGFSTGAKHMKLSEPKVGTLPDGIKHSRRHQCYQCLYRPYKTVLIC